MAISHPQCFSSPARSLACVRLSYPGGLHAMRRTPFPRRVGMLVAVVLALFVASATRARAQAVGLAPSKRTVINLGQTPWKYLKDTLTDGSGKQIAIPANPADPALNDSGAPWLTVGVPYSTNQKEMFQNQESGGGDGNMPGNIAWYRHHFTMDPQYKNSKVVVEFEGVHTGAQVYMNGTFVPGNSAVNPQATHVIGFVGFTVDVTPYLKFDGTDNVLAVRSAKNASWFANPGFSGGFRFGQADSGIFRPVFLYITDKVHIPENTAAGVGTWGTYVATVSATTDAAEIEVQTNVLNEGTTDAPVTLTTQIVDAAGAVVAETQDSRTIPAGTGPSLTPQPFDQKLTVTKPTLWYPNNSVYGGPYLYKVFHTVSMNGVVIDAVESPLGIRTITWDKDFPYINGKAHHLWGGASRYDYPALGTTVPEEQQWRDLQLMAAAGGNLWRPGHSSSSPEFVAAADALGILIVQPSGDGENGFAAHCDAPPCATQVLKSELHRDMILRDRSHPSILAWEADNGITDTTFAQELAAIGAQFDPVALRVQADRTPNPANGTILGCTVEGCEVGVKQANPNNPAWGAEYWGAGTTRQAYDFELAFAAPFVDNWRKGVAANAFGMVQWYFADSPGETNTFLEGTQPQDVRSLGSSMVDMNRFPKMLYNVYEAVWTPFQIRPVVKLAHHWNRSGNVTVNAFSNCPAVRLLINGAAQGQNQVPNPLTSDASSNLTQTTTLIPGQVHWNVAWQAGTVTAQCLDGYGNVVASDAKTTAGPADHVELDVVPEVVRPDHTSFAVTANGSDAAFVVAKVVDAQGVVVPTASNNITFAVAGPATYLGGSEQTVTEGQPYGYHSPGDPELAAEGGLTKIALRSQFQAGSVTVTATSPGLRAGSATLTIAPIANPAPTATAPTVIAQPMSVAVTAGQAAGFSVTASGAAPLAFQWKRNGVAIGGATSPAYQTPATSAADNNAVYSVVVSNSLGSVASNGATLTVDAAAAVAITGQPASLAAVVGQTVQFAVTATGSPTLAYQWQKNGIAIPGAIFASYTTGVLTSADNGTRYAVTVTNPVNSLLSGVATLTVGAALPPAITTQPANVTGLPGQPATFTVAVAGSTPMHFQWHKDGNNVGVDAASLTIAAVQTSDAGSYTVTATNIAGSVTSAAAVLSLAPPGVNLALGKTATASSTENPQGETAMQAIDGDLTTRWASRYVANPGETGFNPDVQSIEIDLGSVLAFDRIVLHWEAAYASAYTVSVSNDNVTWTPAYTPAGAGVGGTEDFTFQTVRARYVRLNLTKRGTQYGYSLFEFEVYNAASCGGGTEHYTVQDPADVLDNLSALSWKRAEFTYDPGAGTQLTQPLAAQYCANMGMRLPTKDEALAISGTQSVSCAFPAAWNTWTSTAVPGQSGYAYTVSSQGDLGTGLTTNLPGWALCTKGTTAVAPVITAQPAPQTAGAGGQAVFTAAATGAAPLTYAWSKNGKAVALTGVASYTTPVVAAADNGAVYGVTVVAGNGLSTTSGTAVLTVSGTATPPGPTPTPTPTPTPVPTGNNFALGMPATASSTENAGYLGAANAVDGNQTTRWASAYVGVANPDSQWLQVDLGTAKTIGQVVLQWEAAYGKVYWIQVSADAQTWTTVKQQLAGAGGTEVLSFAAVSTRYVRMLGVTRGTTYGYSLYEFGVYAPAVAAVAPTIAQQPASQTVAAGVTATFSVVAGGTGPFTYSWRKGGVAISGATAASYTTPVLAAADSGSAYSVVVTNAGGSVTSAAATLTVNAASGGGTGYTIYPGFIGVDLNNNTKGKYADSQVYVEVLAIDPATKAFSWVKPDGTITAASVADNDGPGHLTKNGQNYPNYSFTLAQAKLLKLPQMYSGRIYVSLGEPLYIKITGTPGSIGYAGPNPQNTTDPNLDVHYDWYEFTYNSSGIYINTTQVDQFGLPLLLDVWGNNRTFHQQTGITESIAAIDAEYNTETPVEFHVTPSDLRIFSPAKTTFGAGGANGTYFDGYVTTVWTQFAGTPMVLDLFGGARRFSGTTTAASFVFTEVNKNNGAYVGGTFTIGKPNTQQILACNGPLAQGDASSADRNTVELAIEAQFCAAFDRHDMQDPSTWSTPSAWYLSAPANFYAQFWHRHSVGGLAYGFAYDDVSGQSSTITTNMPEHMAFGIGW